MLQSSHCGLQVIRMPGPRKDVFDVYRNPLSGQEVQVDRYTLTSASGVEVQVGCVLSLYLSFLFLFNLLIFSFSVFLFFLFVFIELPSGTNLTTYQKYMSLNNVLLIFIDCLYYSLKGYLVWCLCEWHSGA